MRVICIFIDGIGIGDEDAAVNPFVNVSTSIFPQSRHRLRPALFDGVVIPTDACLDVPGLPQSATGQTSLFSGLNASQQVGKHLSGFATPSLVKILRQDNIFMKAGQRGKQAAFVNAYTKEFFALPEKVRTRITSVTTAATQTAGLDFFRVEDIARGRSLYHDFTNRALNQRGYAFPELTPHAAGKQLACLARSYDFCVYEYFLSDKIGHLGDLALAIAEIDKLERFLRSVLEHSDLSETVIVLCSDHGNMENMSVMTHTQNPVPTIVWGKVPSELLASIRSLPDVTPFILDCLEL